MNASRMDRAGLSEPGDQYLSFTLAGETFAVDILRVQEIKGVAKITPLPSGPRHLRGVMNLRGVVVPVIDLRVRFGLPEPDDGSAVTIVVTVAGRIAGLVVDAVSDVLDFAGSGVEPLPELGAGESCLSGLARVGDRLVMVIDVDALLGVDAGRRAA